MFLVTVSITAVSNSSILQSLCKREIGWDEEIPQKQLSTWNKWLDQLKELEMIKVDRCYKPSTFESLNIYVKTKFVILYKPVHS
jgi:hypothetical protein